jgi:hypothetical protein
MPTIHNTSLVIGAALSAIAAAMHLAIIVGGPAWYRFFGAGERFASDAAAGRRYPAIVTFGIASLLASWSAYALSGAGVIAPLPLLRVALVLITAVYLIRGLVLLPILISARNKLTQFIIVWSSLICLCYGAVHLLGLAQVWNKIS